MPARLPDCIQRRALPDGSTVYRVRIRRKGAAAISAQFDSMAEALAYRDERLGMVRKLQLGGANDAVTVQQAIDGYRKSDAFKALATPTNTDTTLKYWEERHGTTRLADLPGQRLAVERDRLAKIKRAGNTVNRYLSGLSVSWDWAVESLGALPNQVRLISRMRVHYPPPAKFTGEQLRYLLERADAYGAWPPLALLVRLSLLTTQRKGTLLNIRWCEVDTDAGVIEVARAKNGRALSLVIEGETLELMREHAKKTGAKGTNYLFQSPTLRQPLEVKKHIDALFDDPKLGGLTFKHLRSTALSRLFTHAKLDLPRVMAISGHKTARVLLEHYAHASTDETRRVIREHADMLLGK